MKVNSVRFRSLLEGARQQIREGSGIPHDEFWREVEADQGEPDTPPADERACISE
jgi:hypothetical protein